MSFEVWIILEDFVVSSFKAKSVCRDTKFQMVQDSKKTDLVGIKNIYGGKNVAVKSLWSFHVYQRWKVIGMIQESMVEEFSVPVSTLKIH